MEKRQPFHIVGGAVNWYSRYGKHCGGSSNIIKKQNCHMTQLCRCWEYIWRKEKQGIRAIPAPPVWEQHCVSAAKSRHPYPTLWPCVPSPPGSSVHGILQTRAAYLRWVPPGKIAALGTTVKTTYVSLGGWIELKAMVYIYVYIYIPWRASRVAQLVKNPPAMQETPVQFLGWEDPLEKG